MNDTMPQTGPLLVSRSKAMEMLDVRDGRVMNRLISQGKVKAVRIGRQYRVNVASLYADANGETDGGE